MHCTGRLQRQYLPIHLAVCAQFVGISLHLAVRGVVHESALHGVTTHTLRNGAFNLLHDFRPFSLHVARNLVNQ
jgi:hypothetical protein